MPAAILKAGKAALALLGNEHTRKAVGWVVTAILSPLILLVVILISLLSTTSEHNRAVIDLCFKGGGHSEQYAYGICGVHRGYAPQLRSAG